MMCEFWVAATVVAFVAGAFLWHAVTIARAEKMLDAYRQEVRDMTPPARFTTPTGADGDRIARQFKKRTP